MVGLIHFVVGSSSPFCNFNPRLLLHGNSCLEVSIETGVSSTHIAGTRNLSSFPSKLATVKVLALAGRPGLVIQQGAATHDPEGLSESE